MRNHSVRSLPPHILVLGLSVPLFLLISGSALGPASFRPDESSIVATLGPAQGNTFLFACAQERTYAFNASTNQVIGAVHGKPWASFPDPNVVASPDFTHMYGASLHRFFIIGVVAGKITQNKILPHLGNFDSVAVSPNGKLVYMGDGGRHHVVIYNVTSGNFSWVSHIYSNSAIQVAVSPSSIYAATSNSTSMIGRVVVINATTHKITGVISLNGTIPSRMAISPDYRHLYVADAATQSIAVVSTLTSSVVGIVNMSGLTPRALAVTYDSRLVYVADTGNTVSVVNATTDIVVANITLNTTTISASLAISPDGKSVYVGDFQSGKIFVIRVATNTVGRYLNTNAVHIWAVAA